MTSLAVWQMWNLGAKGSKKRCVCICIYLYSFFWMMHIYYSNIHHLFWLKMSQCRCQCLYHFLLFVHAWKSQGWYHTNKKLCKNLLKKCVRSIMMCRYSPCLVHWYWKIVKTGCPPPGTPTCSVGAESVPEKELTASRDLTASKKSGTEIGEVRVGHWICESVCHSFSIHP